MKALRMPNVLPALSSHVLEDPAAGVFRVSRRTFVDEAVLAEERRRIFDRCWLYLGHASEIRQPGDFLARNVGGRELLFDLATDPGETRNACAAEPEMAARLRAEAERALANREFTRPALEGGKLRALPFAPFPRQRIKQFARGITDFGPTPVPA